MNVVSPGLTVTPMTQGDIGVPAEQRDEAARAQLSLIPMKRFLDAKEIANTMLFLSEFPKLAQPGGAEEGTPKGELNALLVIALASGQYAALNPLCTHATCALVEFAPADGLLHCPCHGSVFTTDGTVRQGPATKPLTTYPATFDGTAVRVKRPDPAAHQGRQLALP